MSVYICVHGHFYQPPREDPWTGKIEKQSSAHPYHDWNERIAAECYTPNCATKILEGRKLLKIVNNYKQMSFNMGPTLLSWLEEHQPETYQAILTAERESREQFSGHGTAIGQVYNHIIMPLASSADKDTQIKWGIADFVWRFGRKPEGMWLAETAVDTPTLEALAENGIKFTILAPWQGEKIRAIGKKNWKKVEGNIDFREPYLVNLPSGKNIAVFFYCGDISGAIAFGGMLNDGVEFAKGLLAQAKGKGNELINIATDGETYGHHHKKGEMALSFCLNYIKENKLANITVYGEYLEKFPPKYEVVIKEPTSWSCAHGVGRWSRDCGCKMNGNFQQKWRGPLREAMNWLRDELYAVYRQKGEQIFKDIWAARNNYIKVILAKNHQAWLDFLAFEAKAPLTPEEVVLAGRLLEMERFSLLMFTSCGWFFDDISGLESTQILRYAKRAMEYARDITGISLEKPFVKMLESAPSNYKRFKNGAKVWRALIA